MKYFSLLICAVSFLTGCNNVTYTTNIDDEILSEHVSSHINKRGLEQFYSVQDALDRGASPLGGIKGESCDVSDDTWFQKMKTATARKFEYRTNDFTTTLSDFLQSTFNVRAVEY